MGATAGFVMDGLDNARTVEILSALAHSSRLDAYRLLVKYLPFGLSAGDVARLLAVQHNTLSTHLSILEKADLVSSRREGRSIIYAANIGTARGVTAFMLKDCCAIPELPDGLGEVAAKPFPAKRGTTSTVQPINVLVICPGNSVRSIMAEALLNREGAGAIRAFSAGSAPAAKPSALTISLLQELGYPTEGLRSKSWLEFSAPDSPRLDVVLNVCDPTTAEAPRWPGDPAIVNWAMPDPASIRGGDVEKRQAFLETYRRLADRVAALVNLDMRGLGRTALVRRLSNFGGIAESGSGGRILRSRRRS